MKPDKRSSIRRRAAAAPAAAAAKTKKPAAAKKRSRAEAERPRRSSRKQEAPPSPSSEEEEEEEAEEEAEGWEMGANGRHMDDDEESEDEESGAEEEEEEEEDSEEEDSESSAIEDSEADLSSSDGNDDDEDDDDDEDEDEELEVIETRKFGEEMPEAPVHVRAIPRSKHLSAEERPENLAELSASESEDEESHRNRIGNVPVEWYKDEDHIGYDIRGKKLARKAKGDTIDEFLSRADDPNRWRTVYDEVNDRHVVLTDEEMSIIHRVRHGKFPHRDFDPYADYGDWEGEKHIESLGDGLEPKRRFIPSKHETKTVMRLINAIRNGWLRKPNDDLPKTKGDRYLLWEGDAPERNRHMPPTIPPPKPSLPGHAESYNPPEEYLPTQEEINQWAMLDPEDRPFNFVPTKFGSLRRVPLYDDFIKERFERCLDLYLCPRTRRKRLNIDPESLIPKLPSPEDLRPFPTAVAVEYRGHGDKVRTLSPSPCGQWLATGSDDGTVRVWEADTGRCVRVVEVGGIVDCVAWNPSVPLLAAAVGESALLVHTLTGSADETRAAEEAITAAVAAAGESARSAAAAGRKVPAVWSAAREEDRAGAAAALGNVSEAEAAAAALSRVTVTTDKRIKRVVWHSRGDYFCTVCTRLSSATSVLIHRVSQGASQAPFRKSKGLVQCVEFHPSKPVLFLATQRHVRVYNLQKQALVKKLTCPAKWISSLSVHPEGDNLVVGSYDRRVCWYDLDMSVRPYKTLKYHKKAVRGVGFHKRYPLMASASDDGKLHVFHGKVYNDLLTNPLIVPVKILAAHEPREGLGVLDCAFHPTQPYIFSCGADGVAKMFA